MSIDTTEKRFEQDIETFLLSPAGGYIKGDQSTYDRSKAVDITIMVNFIKATQPKAWKRYEAIYNDNAEQSFYRRFNECVNENGLIFTLRRGIKDRGVTFSLAYFAPTSALNTELTDL
jgi:type I restriction enzyme, R subunit